MTERLHILTHSHVYANACFNIHVHINATYTAPSDGHYQSLLDQILGLLAEFFHCSPHPSNNLSEFHGFEKKLEEYLYHLNSFLIFPLFELDSSHSFFLYQNPDC